jgi:hypothetical protein
MGSSWENLKRTLQILLVHIFTITEPISLLGLWVDYVYLFDVGKPQPKAMLVHKKKKFGAS